MTVLDVIILFVKCLVVILLMITLTAYHTWFERVVLARLQNRVGPNRAGGIMIGGRRYLGGIFQPLADVLKLFFKEDIRPVLADNWVFILAPALAVIPAIMLWAVIPLGFWPDGQGGNWLQLSDIDNGVLYILALLSIGVYGLAIGGWASNNKYSTLGGVRASAQVLSYELSLGTAILCVVMHAGTLRTSEIVDRQEGLWFFIPQILGLAIFLVSATAEIVRAPFDLVEAEQELVGGYNTEYGAMYFGLFFLAEYMKLIILSAIAVTLYFGGWRFPGLETLGAAVTASAGATAGTVVVGLLSLGSFLLKTAFFSFVAVWVRATLPRLRYDQLMRLGWLVLLPLALINLVITAVVNVVFADDRWVAGLVSFALGLVVLLVAGLRPKAPRAGREVILVKKTTSGA